MGGGGCAVGVESVFHFLHICVWRASLYIRNGECRGNAENCEELPFRPGRPRGRCCVMRFGGERPVSDFRRHTWSVGRPDQARLPQGCSEIPPRQESRGRGGSTQVYGDWWSV